MKLTWLAVLTALAWGAFSACTRVEAAKPSPNISLGDGGGAGEPANGGAPSAGASGEGQGGQYVGSAGAPGSIDIGVWPTFAEDPAAPDDAGAVLASVSARSIGTTTLPLAVRWDELSGATGSPRLVAWNRLDAMTQPYRDRDGTLALCIGVVDREVSAWPDGVDLATDSAASAIERTIDEVYTRYSAHLSHLCFGYEVDRYLAKVSSSAQKRLLALLAHAVEYASQHPLRKQTAIGTAITLGALSGGSTASLSKLLLGDEVVAVYDPLDAKAALKAPQSVADEVATALQTLAAAAGPTLPLTLFEVGYPSDPDAGASEQAQKKYYDALFGVLDAQRRDVAFVGAFGLGDRSPAACQAEALSFGGTPAEQAQRALVRCSMGLRAEPSYDPPIMTDKLAWPAVVAAVSRYR